MPSIFTLRGPQFGNLSSVPMCAIKSVGVRQIAGVKIQIADTQDPNKVPCNGWIGVRPPSEAELSQITSCSNNYWSKYLDQTMPFTAGACKKSNYTTPSDYRNFYRDGAIEKLFSPKTGMVLVVPNNPTWLQKSIDWVMNNCNYVAIAAGALSPAASAAALAACQLTSGGVGVPQGPTANGSGPGPDGFMPKKMSTGAKVAIGAGVAAAAGGAIWAILHFSRR